MNHKLFFTLVFAIALAVVGTAGIATAQGPRPSTAPRAAASTGTGFTYQGQLKMNGAPVNNTCTVSFDLYDAATLGNHLAGPVNGTPNPVTVSNGLFTVQVDFGAGKYNGDARWLQTTVLCTGDTSSTLLAPRQPLTAVPYALGLVPGAVISGSVQSLLTANALTTNVGNPAALRGIADGRANLFPSVPIAVWGESHTGTGVLGASDNGYGVTAYSHSSTANAAYASNDSGGDAIQAIATTGNGVYASTANNAGTKAALYGENTNNGYGVIAKSSTYPLYAKNSLSTNEAYLASTCCAADLYGVLVVHGNMTVTGSKSGFVVDFAKNADRRDLAAGDVVTVVGSASPLVGNIPVALVVKADSAYQTGVVGVVNEHVTRADPPGYDDKPITPGEYLSVVTLGMFRAIQVDAGYGKIHAGDLLVASPHAGYAMKATDRAQAVGAIIGKAMGGLDSGTGTVPVFVTLQ